MNGRLGKQWLRSAVVLPCSALYVLHEREATLIIWTYLVAFKVLEINLYADRFTVYPSKNTSYLVVVEQGSFLLSCRSERGRVVFVSSGCMMVQKLDPTDIQCQSLKQFDGMHVYATNKRQQVGLRCWLYNQLTVILHSYCLINRPCQYHFCRFLLILSTFFYLYVFIIAYTSATILLYQKL